jgi:STE24 endopeptidase
MEYTIFTIIIVILVFDYVFERVLDYLNSKNRDKELPEELQGIYEPERYQKSQQYEKETTRFSMITSTLSFVLILGMLFFGGFAYVDNLARSVSGHPIVIALVFFGILMFASDILSTPFSIYSTFVIEEKYGFNKTTPKTFILDKIKGWLLSAVIGGGILSLIIWFYMMTQENFWLWAWALVTAFSIFMSMFYSSIIVPLFNKQTPLEDGELRDEIEGFSQNVGFKLKNIFVIDGSKRSTKSNAYFTGLGTKKRIVLFDTLIKDLKIKEIVAVLAHEIGHFRKKHIIFGLVAGILQTGLMLYIFSLFVKDPALSKALGAEEHSFHLALITFGILYSPLSFLLGIGMNMISRKNEYEADGFAKKHYDSDALIKSLKKLTEKNLSNLTPHPTYVFFYYSHPPLLQRIRALRG